MTPGEVVAALRSGDVSAIRAAADENFRSQISERYMQEVWASAGSQFGELVSVGPGVVLHDLPLTFEHGEAHLQIAYHDDVISGLVLRPGRPTGQFGV